MTIYDFKKVADLSRDNCFVKKKAFHGTATAGGVSYIGGQLAYESYIDLAELILQGHVTGDRYEFAVTLPHPATPNDLSTDIVLWVYGDNLAVKSDVQSQGESGAPYLMLVGTDKRLRLKYTSTGGTNVAVSMHFRTHIPKDVLGL
jgi:hypothetical protein